MNSLGLCSSEGKVTPESAGRGSDSRRRRNPSFVLLLFFSSFPIVLFSLVSYTSRNITASHLALVRSLPFPPRPFLRTYLQHLFSQGVPFLSFIMRLLPSVALALVAPLVSAHNSFRSLSPSHHRLAARDLITPSLATDLGTPFNSSTSDTTTTVLVPVDPSTVTRVDSALPNPSKRITLYYAEKDVYTQGAHYRSAIEWTMNWHALVIGDAPQIDSFTCGAQWKTVVFNDRDAFDEALDWKFPLVLGELPLLMSQRGIHTHQGVYLVTEDDSSGCSFESPDAPQYNRQPLPPFFSHITSYDLLLKNLAAVHLRSIASSDRSTLTVRFSSFLLNPSLAEADQSLSHYRSTSEVTSPSGLSRLPITMSRSDSTLMLNESLMKPLSRNEASLIHGITSCCRT